MEEVTAYSIMERYQLQEEDCSKQISDSHLEKIAHSNCEKWRSLPSYLKMEAIISKDIEREFKGEEERRLEFLKHWKQERGLDATYRELVNALLEIKCRQDAEKVCELLQKFLSTAPEGSVRSNSRKDEEATDSVTTSMFHFLLQSLLVRFLLDCFSLLLYLLNQSLPCLQGWSMLTN